MKKYFFTLLCLSLIYHAIAAYPLHSYDSKKAMPHTQLIVAKNEESLKVNGTKAAIGGLLLVLGILLFIVAAPLLTTSIAGFLEAYFLLGIAVILGIAGIALLIKS